MNRILSTCVSVLVIWQVILQAEEFKAIDLGNNWYEHEQFGTFYDANNSDWYYHLDHGWIYVDEWDDNGTWMYMANENTSQNTYFHYDGNQYNLITDWEEIADSTGLSLEFLQAVTTASGTDINFTNPNQQDVHVSDVVMPFGWVWTSSSTRDFLYNNYLDEWLYFSRKIKDSDYRYYSYKTKSYINNKEIRELEYSPDIWREALAGFGFDVYLNLDGQDQIKDLNESHENIFGGNAGKLRIKIPKEQIDEDNFWSPLVSNLEQFDNLSNGALFKLLQIDENQESVTITVRTLFHSINVAEKVNSVSSISLLGVDDRRQASARGLDDNSSKEAILLEKAGIIDLNVADYERKLDKYVEVAKVASNKFEEKVQGRDAYRKDAERFTRDLVSNFEQVVDLVIETESIGIQDDTVLDSLLENSDNTKEVNEIQKEAQNLGIRDKQTLEAVFRNADKVVELKSVINDAKALDIYDLDHIAPVLLNAYQVVSLKKVIEASDEVGAKDKENLGAVFQNADKADELKEVIDVARETLGANDGLGGKKFDYSKASILSSTLKNADKAAELKSVLAIAKDLGVQDEEHLTSVFVNAGNARDLITVCYAAVDTFGFNDASGIKKLDSSKASILSSTLKNADKASQLKQVIDVSIELGINDAENLKPVFLNSEQATDLLEVITAADEAGFEDKDTLTVVFQNSDRANDLMAVIEKTREINVQEAVELSSAFEVSLKVLDSKDFLTKEEIASLLSSQNGRLEDSNLSLAVDPEILILISELDEYSPSLPTYETAEVLINTETEVSSSLLE